MKLKEALLSVRYSKEVGIWAEKNNGNFTPNSSARYGSKVFENGGLLDNFSYVGNGESIQDSRFKFTEGNEDFDEEWIEDFLTNLNSEF